MGDNVRVDNMLPMPTFWEKDGSDREAGEAGDEHRIPL